MGLGAMGSTTSTATPRPRSDIDGVAELRAQVAARERCADVGVRGQAGAGDITPAIVEGASRARSDEVALAAAPCRVLGEGR
jgi:hypothetical protein